MAVVLTIGLSIASRTVMDVSLSRQEEEGTATFQAAESGIENALNTDFTAISGQTQLPVLNVGDATVTTTITPQSTIETTVEKGGSVQVRTSVASALPANKQLVVQWGKNTTCPSALLITAYEAANATTYYAKNYAVDPCPSSTSFSNAGVLAGTNGYTSRYLVPISTTSTIVSIQVISADTPISVASGTGGWTLPTQYYTILSQAANNNGNEQRAIMVTRTGAGHPGILDYTLYSGTTINK